MRKITLVNNDINPKLQAITDKETALLLSVESLANMNTWLSELCRIDRFFALPRQLVHHACSTLMEATLCLKPRLSSLTPAALDERLQKSWAELPLRVHVTIFQTSLAPYSINSARTKGREQRVQRAVTRFDRKMRAGKRT